MGSTTRSIRVNAPLRVVYNQWTQFEEFPRFMEGVYEVRQDGPGRLFWKAKIAGKDKQWEAEITEQVPDKRIAWVSIDGTPNSGEVTFEPLDPELTLITLRMEYEPDGFLERAGDVLGIPSGQVEEDLNRFRDFIEQTGKETGGWRGRIGGGEVPDSTADALGMATQSAELAKDRTNREVPAPLAADRLDETFEPEIEPKDTEITRPTDEQIARRAYELYLDRGQTSGHQLEDWFQAEGELSGVGRSSRSRL